MRAPSARKLAIEDYKQAGDGLVGVENISRELRGSWLKLDVDTPPE